MIIIDEINGEIAKLEAQTQTYQTIEKLAALYTVRDHNTIQPSIQMQEPVQVEPTSDFLKLCAGKPVGDVLAVMDELMTTVQALMPKLYEGVMSRLRI